MMSSSLEENNLEDYLEALQKTPSDFNTLRNLLKFLRQTKLRRSDIACQYGHKLLKEHANKLGHIEVWDVYEQVFIAGLDVHNKAVSEECIRKILTQFGESGMRVKRLLALQQEAQGNWRQAEELYQSILKDEPANSIAMKRQICIRKAMGEWSTAIKLLNEYLKIFMADTEAWQELADLYLDQLLYKNAAFCYEELILSFPQTYQYYYKYAEILYTIGGFDNFKMARKYFAYVLELNESHLRALYGVIMSCVAVSNCTKQAKQDKDNQKLFEWAYSKLIEKYKESAPDNLKLIGSFKKESNT